ncbi:hypothetical protein [Collimonas humicola]|uniref:hypothetical protein n=1 Tax=Collimonas humicola TaxID=2825886 RepID=UPI001B8ABEEF|nr:hypothetical protein [Collimonas humicola]
MGCPSDIYVIAVLSAKRAKTVFSKSEEYFLSQIKFAESNELQAGQEIGNSNISGDKRAVEKA